MRDEDKSKDPDDSCTTTNASGSSHPSALQLHFQIEAFSGFFDSAPVSTKKVAFFLRSAQKDTVV